MEQQRDILAVTDSAIESMAMFNLGTAQLEEARSHLRELVDGPCSTKAELEQLKELLQSDSFHVAQAVGIVNRAIASLSLIGGAA